MFGWVRAENIRKQPISLCFVDLVTARVEAVTHWSLHRYQLAG